MAKSKFNFDQALLKTRCGMGQQLKIYTGKDIVKMQLCAPPPWTFPVLSGSQANRSSKNFGTL